MQAQCEPEAEVQALVQGLRRVLREEPHPEVPDPWLMVVELTVEEYALQQLGRPELVAGRLLARGQEASRLARLLHEAATRERRRAEELFEEARQIIQRCGDRPRREEPERAGREEELQPLPEEQQQLHPPQHRLSWADTTEEEFGVQMVQDQLPTEEKLVFDSGAAVHACPSWFAKTWPLEEARALTLRSATGELVRHQGTRLG